MHTASILSLFISGVILVLVASNLLVSVSKELAVKWKLSPLFVSIIIVALGTNLPEFTVLITSLFKGDAGLALGNIIGSNISNISLIFGVGILFHPIKIGTNKTQKNTLIMLFLTLTFVLLEFLPVAKQLKGVLLLFFLIGFITYEYLMAVYGRHHEDKSLLRKIERQQKKLMSRRGSAWISLLAAVGSVVGLGLGSSVVVSSIEQLSELFHLSTTLLGMTLVATTTSLPELITIIVAAAKNEDKVVVGTLIGSNIYNLSLFIPIIQLSPFATHLRNTDLIYLEISVLLFAFIIISSRGKNIKKAYGWLSILLFITFVVSSFFRS